MKRFLFFCLFCSLSLSSFAFSVGDFFFKNSRFWQNRVSLDILSGNDVLAGMEFDIVSHRDIENKIYAFRVPLMLKFNMVDFTFEPFFYPNTNNDASAYGGKLTVRGVIRDNQITNNSSQGYLKAAYAVQSANVERLGLVNKEDFKQLVFEGGLNFNFGGFYNFDIGGNIFNYPDNVKEVGAFGGIMNQAEVGNLGTIDYVLALPQFSVGGGITWLSTESNAKSSVSYRYIDYEKDLSAHSIMVKTIVPVDEKVLITLIYNHLFETHRTNRDLFGAGINYLF